MKVHFKDLLLRLTGITVPIFGVSWLPPEPERKIVRDILVFLEDRRALYNDFAHEIEDQVTQSILQIRSELTNAIRRLPDKSKATESLRAMRAACRQYIDDTHNQWSHHCFGSMAELGRLRATFGIHVACLALQYGIDVEGDLASILPPKPLPEDDAKGGTDKPSVGKKREKKGKNRKQSEE
jgi:signal transduction histidine kinase